MYEHLIANLRIQFIFSAFRGTEPFYHFICVYILKCCIGYTLTGYQIGQSMLHFSSENTIHCRYINSLQIQVARGMLF